MNYLDFQETLTRNNLNKTPDKKRIPFDLFFFKENRMSVFEFRVIFYFFFAEK